MGASGVGSAWPSVQGSASVAVHRTPLVMNPELYE